LAATASATGKARLTELKLLNFNVLSVVFERLSVIPGLSQALEAKLPVDARGFADLEKRLVRMAAKELVAPAIRAVLVAVHRVDGFVHSCVDRACYERGLFREGPRKVSVRLLSGDSVEVTTPYACVDRSGKPGRRRGRGRHGAEGSGSYPVLAQPSLPS
jgi:hypothetical protein